MPRAPPASRSQRRPVLPNAVDIEVTLYRRIHCGLCDDSLVALRELSRHHGFTIIERDIDGDPDLRARYDEVVPVIAIDLREIARAPVDLDALREAIETALAEA